MSPEEATQCIYDFLACAEEPAPADAVIAFGSYHTTVAETAARLVLDGAAPVMVCSGSKTKLTEDIVRDSEAALFASVAQAAGVPTEKILLEPTATNTGENVRASMKVLRAHGIEPKTLLACAMPPHLRRVVATFAKEEPGIRIIPILVPFHPSNYRTRQGMSWHHRLVAELDRLREYPTQGFTVPITIPPTVLVAEQVLRRLA